MSAAEGLSSRIVRSPEILEAYRHDVSALEGDPEGLFRPRDVADLQDLVRWARDTGTPLLPVGARTSTTGASVAESGVVVDLASICFEPEISRETKTVRIGAAANLGELRDHLRAEGLYLPPDPTSAPDCTVGGAVATNASGASTYRYGPVDSYVVGIELVDGTGEVGIFRRLDVEKRALGPVALQDPVGWLVGSEGTLGIFTAVELRVLEDTWRTRGLFVGFETRPQLLSGVAALRGRRAELRVRQIEWLDGACCELLVPHAGRLTMPGSPAGGLYMEVEGRDEGELDAELCAVADALEAEGADLANAQVLPDRSSIRDFAELRHRVPDTLNGRGAELARERGGAKLSTDWSVPIEELHALLCWTEEALAPLGLEGLYGYGHIGNGHPHLNLICPDAKVRSAAKEVLAAQMRKVVAAGGVPVSEHGIGKIKRDLVAPYLPPGFEEGLRGLKSRFDPADLLARGNLIP